MPANPSVADSADHELSSTTLELGERVRDFADGLAQAAAAETADEFRGRLAGLLVPLQSAFSDHRRLTEGSHGQYAAVVGDTPRVANAVRGLVAEHEQLGTAISQLAAQAAEPVDAVILRQRAQSLVDGLTKHRQRDADLIHQAYGTDIGGE